MKNFLFITGMLVSIAACATQQNGNGTSSTSSVPSSSSVSSVSSSVATSSRSSFSSSSTTSSISSSSIKASSSSSSGSLIMQLLDQEIAEAYLRANINVVSKTTPDSVGGPFSVTQIEWENDGTALVTYQDRVRTMQARILAIVNAERDVQIVNFTELSN